METKKEVIQYFMKEVEKLIPLKIISKKKKAGTIIFTVENNCRIKFCLRSVLGGEIGRAHV